MTRIGKIARLPDDVRLSLNERIRRGDAGPELLAWLNSLPEVLRVLQTRFQGSPITEQNLSKWRLGGYQDWLAQQQKADLASRILRQAGELKSPPNLGNGVAALLAVELADVAVLLLREAPNLEERWKRLKGLLNQMHALRRDDHQAVQNRLQQKKAGSQPPPGSAADGQARLLIQALHSLQSPPMAGPDGLD